MMMKTLKVAVLTVALWTSIAFFIADTGVGAQPSTPGASTSALQSALNALVTTANTYLDGLEALIGTTNTNTGASATALQIIDDWDETDRAKVNLIVGQAGVAAGAGVNGVTVLRTGEATDSQLSADMAATRTAIELMQTEIAAINGKLNTDPAHDGLVNPNGPQLMLEAKDFNGSAFPNVVTAAGDAVRWAASLFGVSYGMWVNEDGSKQVAKLEDDPAVSADLAVPVLTRRRDTAAGSAGTENDYQTLDTDNLGRLWVRPGNACADDARIQSAPISESTAAINEIIALNGSDLIYVCGYKWVTTAATSLKWVYGTGSDCATGTTDIEGAQPFAATGGTVEGSAGATVFAVPAGKALCLSSSAATAHGGRVSYVRTAAP